MQPFPPLSPGAFPKEHTEKAALQSVCSPCFGRVLRCSARNRIRVPQIPIPDSGRSPDFVHHGVALPGFPVVCKTAPVHSDCIAPDSHRIPFSSAFEQTPLCYNFIFFQTVGLYHILSNCQSILMAGYLKSDVRFFILSVLRPAVALKPFYP